MNRIRFKISRVNTIKAILYIAFICFIISIYFPRSLADVSKMNQLRIEDINEIHISVIVFSGTGQRDKVDYDFTTPEQIKELSELFSQTHIRKKIIPKKMVNTLDYKGYFILVSADNAASLPYIDLLTEDIVVINKKQYIIYGDLFDDKLDKFLKENK